MLLLLPCNGLGEEALPSAPAGQVAKPGDALGQLSSDKFCLVEEPGALPLEILPRVVTFEALRLSGLPADPAASKFVTLAGELLRDRLELAILRRRRLITKGELLALLRGLGPDCSVPPSELTTEVVGTNVSRVASVPLGSACGDVLGAKGPQGVAGRVLLDD